MDWQFNEWKSWQVVERGRYIASIDKAKIEALRGIAEELEKLRVVLEAKKLSE